ncbi:MAG: NADH-quinone oxidoreductase subunit A, partial [Mariprofundus sp.]|nr:NADH-quinone oxidoreductase subunit A [Mariprofundus sp.]
SLNSGGVLMGAAYLANEYAPIFIFILIAIGMGAMPLVMTLMVSEQKPNAEKLSAYECGFEAFEDARLQIDVRFYLLAILFVIFDLESAFLFPWAIVLNKIGLFGFVEMVMFLVILLVGYVYAWKKGALQWE